MEGARFSPRPRVRISDHCSVENCQSASKKDLTLRFHNFPKENSHSVFVRNKAGILKKVDKLKAWKRAIKIETVTPQSKVCSLHFKREDYILPDAATKKRHLKQSAVPSCNLPGSSQTESPGNAEVDNDSFRHMEFSPVEQKNVPIICVKVENPDVVIKEEDFDDGMVYPINDFEMIESESTFDMMKSDPISATMKSESSFIVPLFREVGIQVGTADFMPKFSKLLKNDADLNTATGINSFRILNCIVKLLRQVFGDQLEHTNIKLSLYDRVIMTYLKLKQNLSYSFLAILFPCYSMTNCRRVFFDMLSALTVVLEVLITWPSKEITLRNEPEGFVNPENVKIAIDSTEIFIQEPKTLCCRQILTQSDQKKVQSCKILTGVAPDGLIVYKSQPWGGGASETSIFEKTDLIQLLEPGDTIMADKKFVIHDLCAKNHLNLITPPLLNHKRPSLENSPIIIARKAIRVNVERSIRRIKTFKIVNEPMPAKFVPQLGNIFTVICATINLSSSHNLIEEATGMDERMIEN